MIDKLKSLFSKAVNLKKTKIQTSMKIIYCYGGGLALMAILLVVAWLVKWYETGTPDIPTLINIFKEYTTPAVIAAFTFVSVFCIDKDRDGRPDIAEAKAKEAKTTTTATSTFTNLTKTK